MNITYPQIVEIKQKENKNGIIAGEAGIGRDVLAKREIAFILATTDENIIVVTNVPEEYEKFQNEYQGRISVFSKKNDNILDVFDYLYNKEEKKSHFYIWTTELPKEISWDIMKEAEKYSVLDVTIVCNEDEIISYADTETNPCITILDISQMSAKTGEFIAKKVTFRYSDYISKYTNIFIYKGCMFELA